MSHFDIRSSLNYRTYIEHSQSLKEAADENLDLFLKLAPTCHSEGHRVKTLGLMRASMLLYAVSLELILKDRALFIEKENIENGKIKSFSDFLKKLKGNKNSGHDYFKLIEVYDIKIDEEERNLLNNFCEHAVWAGRFPFPRSEKEILELENSTDGKGRVGPSHKILVQKFIDNQISTINA